MAYKYEDKEKARQLFIQGYSLTEISATLGIHRGTLHNWKTSDNWKFQAKLCFNVFDDCSKDKTLSRREKKRTALKHIIHNAKLLLSELD